MRTIRGLIFLSLVLLAATGMAWAARNPTVLRLATTTSTVDSGLLDYLLPVFGKDTGIDVHVVSVGTGAALKLGMNGDVDVVLVHARQEEDKFVAEGYGVNRRDVMHNDFLIVGPEEDPAGMSGEKNATKAMKKIAETESKFISRGDKSGTDMKEKELWKAAGITPEGKWFMESGQGMGATLTMADEVGAYTLTDRATFTSYNAKVRLKALCEGDPKLFNPYGIIAVNPKKHKGIQYGAAMKFIKWMTSEKGQKLIGAFKMKGVMLYVPDVVKPGKKK